MTECDGASDPSASERVIEQVAEAEGVSPTALSRPLNEVVDPEALDALFEPQPDGRPRNKGRVEFEYYGYAVSVDADGSVTIEDT
jgi:hypothetical protein